MSKKIEDDDDDYEVSEEDEILEKYEKLDSKRYTLKRQLAARRRLEQLMENRELDRMISGDFYDWG